MAPRFALLALLLLVACDRGTADDDDSTAEIPDHLDPCTFSDGARASVWAEEAFTYWEAEETGLWEGDLGAHVLSNPDPLFYSLKWQENDCRVWWLDFGECEPECEHGELCTVDDECTTYPVGISGGTVTVEVPGDSYELQVWEHDPGRYYGPDDLGDLFDPGDTVGVTISGDAFPAVTLQARGVQSMDESLAHDEWSLPFDDKRVEWTPGDDPDACVRVSITSPTAGHGGPYRGMIECVTEDTGSLTIPAAIMVLFPESVCPVIVGSDCHYSEITRFTRQTVQTDAGPAELSVRSTAHFWYDHTSAVR